MKKEVSSLKQPQWKNALLGVMIVVAMSCGEMVWYLVKVSSIFHKGTPQTIPVGVALMAFLGYVSLVGLFAHVLHSYQHQGFLSDLFLRFSKNTMPSMDFHHYKKEEQFQERDWTTFNQIAQDTIQQIKIALNKEQPEMAEGKEKETIAPAPSQDPLPSVKIGTKLPTFHNSASIASDEMERIQRGINQSMKRRMSKV